MKTLFLGGTCGENNWREGVIQDLWGVVTCFDPVVRVWNDEAQRREELAKANSDYVLFYLGWSGTGLSAYSMVEATMALYDRCESTIVVFDYDEIPNEALRKSLKQTETVLRQRFPRAKIFGDLQKAVGFLRDS